MLAKSCGFHQRFHSNANYGCDVSSIYTNANYQPWIYDYIVEYKVDSNSVPDSCK